MNHQMNNKLVLPRPLVNQMLAHAQQSPQQEICGLIAVDHENNMRYVRIDNRATDSAHHYRMDDKQLVDNMRLFRQNNEQLHAIVHSHPAAEAQPSILDIEQANYPDAYYLIISLNTRGVLEMRAYKITRGVATEVAFTI
jgi:proteasome lid subunit RPN8/RPN11